MDNKIFIDGMFFKRPDDTTKEKAPSVKGKISIKMSDFLKFLEQYKNEEWLNIDLKESKDKTKLYLELNTYGIKSRNSDGSLTPEF